MRSTENSKPTSEDLKRHFLVLRCQVGDERAFGELYSLFGSRTLRFLENMVKGPHAEDLNQEVWITIYKRIRTLVNADGFRLWIFQITRNKALDYFRQSKRMREFQDALSLEPEREEGDVDDLEFDKEFTLLKSCLNDLSKHHGEVLILHFLEGMDYEEIALITGCSKGTVKSRMHNAKVKLKNLIDIKIKSYE